MTKKSIAKSVRLTQEVFDYIDSAPGNGFNEKFENIILEAKRGESDRKKELARLDKQIEKQLSGDEPDFDIRALHLLYDHKVLMNERLKYMMAKGVLAYDNEILDEYMEVVNNMLTARNLLIKTSITGNVNCLDRFEKYIMTAKTKEIEVLNKVVERL